MHALAAGWKAIYLTSAVIFLGVVVMPLCLCVFLWIRMLVGMGWIRQAERPG